MPYAMSYGQQQGDPFLGGLIKGALKIGKGIVGGVAREFLGGGRPQVQQPVVPIMPGGTFPGGTVVRAPGIRGAVQRALPGGATGLVVQPRKRKRMNPANAKALRRAIRRQDGFVKLARRALKGSGYTIVSRGSRRPRRDLPAGHSHVR